MVDTVTLIAASAVGLAVDGETVPYVSGWGEQGALEAVTEFAETIDRTARRIEDVLLDRMTVRTREGRERTKRRIVELFLHGDTQGNAPQSKWAALNAIVEYGD